MDNEAMSSSNMTSQRNTTTILNPLKCFEVSPSPFAVPINKEATINNSPVEKAIRKPRKNLEEEKRSANDPNMCRECGMFDMIEKDGNRVCKSCGLIADKVF